MRVLFCVLVLTTWVGSRAASPSVKEVRHVIDRVRKLNTFKRNLHSDIREPPKECPLAKYHVRKVDVKEANTPRYNDLLTAMRILNEEYTLDELKTREVTQEFQRQASEICDGSDVKCDVTSPYRTADGSCNNIQNPRWGSMGAKQNRMLPAAYDDGIGLPRNTSVNGEPLPHPRDISLRIHRSPGEIHSDDINLQAFQFGQFLDHDITFTPQQSDVLDCCTNSNDVDNCAPIHIQKDEGFFSYFYQGYCMNVPRSDPFCDTGENGILREQRNDITSYIDASNVYGSTEDQTNALRDGAFIRFEDDRLPRDPELSICTKDGVRGVECNLAGDVRANIAPSLTAYHHLFALEHNRIASLLRDSISDDETLFQETRRILIAIMQKITYEEFLPSFISNATMDEYGLASNGNFAYDASLDATMINEFGIGYRFGHTWIPSFMAIFASSFFPEDFAPTEDTIDNLDLYYSDGNTPGPDGLALWLSGESSQETDRFVQPSVQTFLFKNEETKTAFDLVSLNIQRGRDHGIPSYTAYRKLCNPSANDVKSFSDLTNHREEIQKDYAELYSDPNDIDLFSGLLTESRVDGSGSQLGPTLECILGTQFRNLKYGDRFWFEGSAAGFNDDQLAAINEYTMAKVLCNNYGFKTVNYPNAFRFTFFTDKFRSCKEIPDLDIDLFKPSAPVTSPATDVPVSTNPTNPPTSPSNPPTNPTSPSNNPTSPSNNPTNPPSNPTNPPTSPSIPPTRPLRPESPEPSNPSNPSNPPTNPPNSPTSPPIPPTNPLRPGRPGGNRPEQPGNPARDQEIEQILRDLKLETLLEAVKEDLEEHD